MAENNPDADIKLTKECIAATKRALEEEGIKALDLKEIDQYVKTNFGFEPEEIIAKELSDTEIMWGIMGHSYCGNCNEGHPMGVVLDSKGNLLRNIKPEHLMYWGNGGYNIR